MIARELDSSSSPPSAPTGDPSCSARATRRSSRTSTPATCAPAGRRSASASSPTPRTRPSAQTCSRPAGARSITRARPSSTPTTTARSSSCAATSTSTADCARAQGHIEPFAVAPAVATRRARDRGRPPLARRARRGAARAGALDRPRGVHHGGRRVFSALGLACGADSAPLRPLSLEDEPAPALERPRRRAPRPPRHGRRSGRPDAAPAAVPPTEPVWGCRRREDYAEVVRVWREGPAPLLDPVPGMSERERLRIAMVIPPFRRGSGGHNTLLQILTRLEQRGHTCSLWLHDFTDQHLSEWTRSCARRARVLRAPERARATRASTPGRGPMSRSRPAGRRSPRRSCSTTAAPAPTWSTTTSPSSTRPRPTSCWPQDSYRHGLHCIAASPWLRDLLIERYGVSADAFELGVEHDIYRPRRPAPRGHDRLLRAPHDARAGRPDRDDGAAGAAPPPPRRAHRPVRGPEHDR